MPARLDPEGVKGPTAAQARGPQWRRSSRGLYVPSRIDEQAPEQRIVEAGAVLPSYGGVTGWAALRWMGAMWFDGLTRDGRRQRPVTLATSCHDVRDQPGIAVSAEGLDPSDLTVHDQLRVTTALRSVLFEMRYADSLVEAMVAFDMAAFSDLVSREEMHDYLVAHSGWTGIPQARDRAWPLTSENAWSPWEVYTRKVWEVDAGLPRPLCNTPLWDRYGRMIACPDLFDEEAGIAVEFDGSMHLHGGRRARDIDREESLRRHDIEYVDVVRSHFDDVDALAARMWAARRRARWLPEHQRSWTTEPPPWWIPATTVAQRRAMTPTQRARFLAHRRRAG